MITITTLQLKSDIDKVPGYATSKHNLHWSNKEWHSSPYRFNFPKITQYLLHKEVEVYKQKSGTYIQSNQNPPIKIW